MSVTGLLFVAAYFFGICKALAGRPIYGLYAYFATFYLHPPVRWWGQGLPDLRWSLLASLVTLIAIIIHKEKNKKFVFGEFKENKVFLIFVLFVLLQGIWALRFNVHSEYMFLAVKFLILVFVIQNAVKTDKDVLGLVIVNGLGCVYMTYLGMMKGGGRMEGLGNPGMGGANQLGQHLGAILIMCSYFLLANLGKKKFLMVPVVLMVLNGVFLTQSRGVLVGLGLIGLLSLFFIPKQAKKLFYSFLILGGVAGGVLMGPQIVERFKTMMPSEEGEQDRSAKSRFVIIECQFKMWSERPIHGWGHRGTLLLSPTYIPEEYHAKVEKPGQQSVRASHNLLMTMMVDHGLIGTILYYSIIAMCMFKLLAVRKGNFDKEKAAILLPVFVGLCLALLSIMISGMGSNNKKSELDIWLIAMIPLVYSMLHRKEEKDVIESDESK